MCKRLLVTVPAVLVFGIANAQPLHDYSRDTIRVTAQWSHSAETPANHRAVDARLTRANTIVSASPIAQMAVLPTAIQKQVALAKQTEAAPEVVAPEADESYDIPVIQNLLGFARKHLSSRYRSGGTSPSGFDCSGFVRYCFTKFGVSLPHSSAAQAGIGAKIDREFAKPGDLIFFNGHAASKSRVGHVGIITEVINDQIKFIHSASSGGVKFDFLNADYYRKRFVTIRRVAHMVANK
ncbi:C40 family peptidase [Fibrella sp. WM1]|uniref:C40 family peptidase n=1 Tax=Fibrella musci TaxID=3242485 RepID=UPI003521EFAD